MITKETFYMWTKAAWSGLVPAPLIYSAYVMGWLTPRPGYEYVFEDIIFWATTSFFVLSAVIITAVFYNAYDRYKQERINEI